MLNHSTVYTVQYNIHNIPDTDENHQTIPSKSLPDRWIQQAHTIGIGGHHGQKTSIGSIPIIDWQQKNIGWLDGCQKKKNL
jgi:hypothetical protein